MILCSCERLEITNPHTYFPNTWSGRPRHSPLSVCYCLLAFAVLPAGPPQAKAAKCTQWSWKHLTLPMSPWNSVESHGFVMKIDEHVLSLSIVMVSPSQMPCRGSCHSRPWRFSSLSCTLGNCRSKLDAMILPLLYWWDTMSSEIQLQLTYKWDEMLGQTICPRSWGFANWPSCLSTPLAVHLSIVAVAVGTCLGAQEISENNLQQRIVPSWPISCRTFSWWIGTLRTAQDTPWRQKNLLHMKQKLNDFDIPKLG